MPAQRILLADDDGDLSGVLAQRLRADGYEVSVAPDGTQALRMLETQPPQLALLDYHMPGLTGVEVCRRARQAGHTLPLLLLTSVSERSTVERALEAGITGYVLKPLRYEDLLAEVRNHLGMPGNGEGEVESALSPKLSELLDKISMLPAMPTTTQKLLEVLNNPSAGAKELSKVITLDPAITAQVLRLANSAYYGQGGKVSDVTKAVILIGFAEISHALMALSLASLFVRKDAPEIIDRVAFWEHALSCSVIAGQLARRAAVEDPNQVIVAGLLHDLGKLVMAYFLPEDYAGILRRAAAERRATRDVEREVLGNNHALLGEALAMRWKLPLEISQCIRYHHVPLSVENLDHATVALVRVICAADALCKAASLGSSGDDLVEEIPERVWNLLSVDQKAAEDAVRIGRRSLLTQKAALGSAGGKASAEEEPGIPVLHLLETEQAVALTGFALQSAGYAPYLVRSWGDGTRVLEANPDIGTVVIESGSLPQQSRFLETVLRWRKGLSQPGILFLSSGKRLEAGMPAASRLAACPKPLGTHALKEAMAALGSASW
jgi:putative nucleotidyltransferase with HDIG domain